MSYRTFVDPSGVSWQVWEVRPTTVERRAEDRRSRVLPFEGPERRSGAERRVRPERRVNLGPELAKGWLAFHSAEEKRRLAPVPESWTRKPSAALAELCEAAQVVGHHEPHEQDDSESHRRAG
ncbi:MAG TPA: hypothetical protein VFZ56_10740 [Gemmatimonadaceae bacterium]